MHYLQELQLLPIEINLGCSITATFTVNAIPSAPTVISPLTYCFGSTVPALTATGSSLLWYTVSTGGTGSATAPIPSTASCRPYRLLCKSNSSWMRKSTCYTCSKRGYFASSANSYNTNIYLLRSSNCCYHIKRYWNWS